MLTNYFKIAWRNLVRHKGYSFINISGLAIGIAACMLLFLIVKYEMSYEKFQPRYPDIYRVVSKDDFSDGVEYTPGIPFPAVDAIRTTFPGYTTGLLFAGYGSQVTVPAIEPSTHKTAPKKFIEETGFFFADPQFFEVFKYTWLKGSPAVLNQPNMTVLTQEMAEKYFGDWENAVGRLLLLDNAATVTVAGILKDPPANSDFPLKIITSYETARAHPVTYGYTNDWGNTTSNFQLFMLVPPHVSTATVNTELKKFSRKHFPQDKVSKRTSYLQPLSEIHYDARFGSFGDHSTSKSTLWTLSLIGVFIIIMACINFINLSTAKAVGRSKEVGIRKVLGSNRVQLFGQVMGETGLIVIVGILFASLLSLLCIPFLNNIASIPEKLTLFSIENLVFLLVLLPVVTLFAGLYPALVLSGFKPALALKNKITAATVGGISLRRGLVVTQFAISQILIIGTIVAISQMNFIRTADLGFNKEALLIINANADSVVHARQEVLKHELLRVPGVQSVSFSSDVPSSENNWSGNFAFDHRPDEKFNIFRKAADVDYFRTYGLQLQAGRIFSPSDTANEIIVNETLVTKLGLKTPEEILGKQIRSGRSDWKYIVGVVKDFKTNSLREEVKPLMILQRKDRYAVTGLKLRSSDLARTQAAVETAWNKHLPEYAYTNSYMDENIAEFYKQEEYLSLLYKIFAGIAILISGLGLFGLVSFMAVQKTKEVGIRKVLGASVSNIVFLFSKEFTLLIAIACLIAIPVGYYMMSNWLRNFVYRIDIGMWIFLSAIVGSILIAWLTVGYKAIRAAVANPVTALRSE